MSPAHPIPTLRIAQVLHHFPLPTHILSQPHPLSAQQFHKMSDAWFNKKLYPYGNGNSEDGCHPAEAQALKAYYHNLTTAPAAAKAITRPIAHDSLDLGADLSRLWSLLIDALLELPSSEIPKLIELLSEIEKLQEPDLKDRWGANMPSEGRLWKGLPGFGHMWADELKQDDWRDGLANPETAERDSLREKHIRKAQVEARLAVNGIGGIPLDWGYECITDALERKNAILDIEIAAAAEWIRYAGGKLYAGVVDGVESWALERVRDFGMENKRMRIERWAFWKQRLEAVGTLAEDERVREAVMVAVREMEVVESGLSGRE